MIAQLLTCGRRGQCDGRGWVAGKVRAKNEARKDAVHFRRERNKRRRICCNVEEVQSLGCYCHGWELPGQPTRQRGGEEPWALPPSPRRLRPALRSDVPPGAHNSTFEIEQSPFLLPDGNLSKNWTQISPLLSPTLGVLCGWPQLYHSQQILQGCPGARVLLEVKIAEMSLPSRNHENISPYLKLSPTAVSS